MKLSCVSFRDFFFFVVVSFGSKEIQRCTGWPAGTRLLSISIWTCWWLSTELSFSSLHHLSHFSGRVSDNPVGQQRAEEGWVWCLSCWTKQTAGFSRSVIEGGCLCSQLCGFMCMYVCEFKAYVECACLVSFPLCCLYNTFTLKSFAEWPFGLFKDASY